MNLAAIPSPSTAVWQIGPLPLRAYAVCIIIGIVAASWITETRLRRRGAPPYFVLDIAIWAVPLGIVGARVYSLITSPQAYFGAGHGFWEWAAIWHGGLGIWGAVAGGVLGAWIVCRQRGVAFSFVADAAAPALPVAQAIGRWGNWFNNELYGRATSLPWGLEVHKMDAEHPGHAAMSNGVPVVSGVYQPTFLYESLWDLGVAVLVWALDRKFRFGRGRAFALYVMAYTAGRFWVELLRDDPANHILGLRVNSWVSILVFLLALLYVARVRGPGQRMAVDEDGTVRMVPLAGAPDPASDAVESRSAGDGDRAPSDRAETGDSETGGSEAAPVPVPDAGAGLGDAGRAEGTASTADKK